MYIPLLIIYRFALGFCMSYFRDCSFVTLYLLGLSLPFIIYNLVNLPFQNSFHNYRSNVCHITELIIIIVANYNNIIAPNLNEN